MKITQTRRLHCVECIDRIIEKEVRVPNAESARLCPLPRNVFDFRAQNGEIWCILGAIF